MLVVFDLDGTIAHTEPTVRRAYEEAGAPIPAGLWGAHYSEWTDDKTHLRKNKIYLRMIHDHGVDPGPLYDLYRRLMHTNRDSLGILTGASSVATYAVLAGLGLLPPSKQYLVTGATLEQKRLWLRKNGPGIYLDDDNRAAEYLRRECQKWTVLEPHMWSFPQRV